MVVIQPDKCYQQFDHDAEQLSEHCKSLLQTGGGEWQSYYGWNVKEVPRVLFLQDSMLAKINQRFPIRRAAILRTEPFQNYIWHKDEYRGVCVNMSLSTDTHSHCLFGVHTKRDSAYFTELTYEPFRLYLFNNQFPHTVINFDQERFMLSVEFVAKKEKLDYECVQEWAQQAMLFSKTSNTS